MNPLASPWRPEQQSIGASQTSSVTATQVINDATGLAPSGSEVTGASFHDTANVTGVPGATPTGIVTYSLFENDGCTGTPASSQNVTLISGSVLASSSTGELAAGNYSFQAMYYGDGNYLASTSSCEMFSVGKAPTTTTTVVLDSFGDNVTNTEIPLGSTVTDNATVTGTPQPFTITGTLTYNFFTTNSNCTASFLSGTVAVGSQSNPQGPLAAGNYSFQAIYNGDSNYPGSTGSCEPFSVLGAGGKVGTTITTEVLDEDGNDVANTEVPLGTIVNDLATLTPAGNPAPSGKVFYKFFKNGGCTGKAASDNSLNFVGAPPPSPNEMPLAPGDYSFMAMYSGDSNFIGSTSACETFSVEKAPVKITTKVMANGSDVTGKEVPLGTIVQDLATVDGGVPGVNPTGKVTYNLFVQSLVGPLLVWSGTAPVGSSDGPQNSLPAGDYNFQVSYGGDKNFLGGVGPLEPFSISPAPTILLDWLFGSNHSHVNNQALPLGPIVYDQANVTGAVDNFTITGTVTYNFFTNGYCLDTPFASGTVGAGSPSSPQGPLGASNYSFNATYSGDGNYTGSASGCEMFSVNQAPTANSNTVVPQGSTVTDRAAVTGNPQPFTITGTVTYNFFTNGMCTGTPFASVTVPVGSPSPSEGPLGPGTYSTQAIYGGDRNYQASTSSCQMFSVGETVGGVVVPINKLALLAPFIGLASLIVVALAVTALYVRRAKGKEANR
jgi:hypothetical protein